MTVRIDGTNTTANPGITGADADTGLQFGTDEVKIVTGGTDAVTVDASQRVGIGTTSPGARFQIEDTDSASAYTSGAILGTQTSVYKQIVHTNQGTGTNEAGIVLRAGTGSNIAEWGLSAVRTGATSGDLIFRTRTGASSSAEQLRIDSAGLLKFDSGFGSAATAYGVRAWANFDGTGTVGIRDSGNVSSITDNGTGDYTANFSTSLVDNDYAVSGSTSERIGSGSGDRNFKVYRNSTYDASGFRMAVYSINDALILQDNGFVSFMVVR